MILVDTSAWVEFLRKTGSPVNVRFREELEAGLAITEVIRMEVLCGARDEARAAKLGGLLLRATMLSLEQPDFDSAAALYRTCRRNAYTPRSIVDCLIAAVAIRQDIEVLHNDVDYSTIATFSALRQVSG